MSAAKWIPSHDELDALARLLQPSEPGADRVEQRRTRVLASAAGLAQHSRSRRGAWIALAGVAVVAAALLAIVLLRRDTTVEPAKETVAELRPSHFERGVWPAYRLALHDGMLSIAIASLDAGERFTLATSDAELETRGARFVALAEREQLAEVHVEDGVIELRVTGQHPVFLAAGQSWRAPLTKTAQVDNLVPANHTPIATETKLSAPKAEPERPALATRPPDAKKEPKVIQAIPPSLPPKAETPVELPAKPGELEFRRGWTSLRSGDAATAATAFKTACNLLGGDTLGEDACYWSGVAARRAGLVADARAALTRFVQRFPSSARAGEASALLGWILYEANELDAAEQHFRRAASDRVPTVKASAEKGLEAVARKRKR